MAVWASEDQDPQTGLRKRGGGKLNRSETVTVRLDPKLNYLCELAARAQRRTKSSFIEWAVETALNAVTVPGTYSSDLQGEDTVSNLGRRLWDVDELDRLIALVEHAPALMDHEEQLLWKSIRANGWLWRGGWRGTTSDGHETWTWDSSDLSALNLDRLREHFEGIKAYVRGDATGTGAPDWVRTRPLKEDHLPPRPQPQPASFESDLDDEVPF